MEIYWIQAPEDTTIGKFRQNEWIDVGTLLKVKVTVLKWHQRNQEKKSFEEIWLVGDMNGYGDSQGTYNEDDVTLLAWSNSLCNFIETIKCTQIERTIITTDYSDRDSIRSEITEIENILKATEESEVLVRLSLHERLAELRKELEDLK